MKKMFLRFSTMRGALERMRWFVLGVFACCLLPALVSAAEKPNIIFILADDLGYGDPGCYGQKKIQTPNLDRLAAEGVRFTQCYAGGTVCAPSRASLMTGLHTGHVRIRGNSPEQYPLQPGDVTVAELLKAAGYKTGAIGKWGLGAEGSTGIPNKQGFDEFLGYLTHKHAHDYYPEFVWRNQNHYALEMNSGGRKGGYTHDLFTFAALNFIRINSPDVHDPSRRFFLYLAYTIPHAHNDLGRRTGNGMEVPSDEPYSAENWPQTEKNKAAMITRMDADIGRIMDRLRELKIDDKTLVFFTSDNGPHKEGGVDPKFFNSSGPLRGIKRDLYEGGIRVPMIAWWPGRIKAGSVSDHPWAFWDFLPTAAELAGVEPPAGLDGISVVPTLLGKGEQRKHEFLYWEFHEGGFKQAARMGDWKGVRLGLGKPLELYNLKTDLAEQNNVAAKHPEIVAKLETYLKEARTESERWPLKAEASTGAAAAK